MPGLPTEKYGEWNSSNSRLERLYHGGPRELVNRELTLPCSTHPVYLDERVKDHPETVKILESLLRITMPSSTLEHVSQEVRDQIRILASPYECGRVLECDQEIVLDGIPYTVTAKGGGCTTFGAQGAESRFFPANRDHGIIIPERTLQQMNEERIAALRSYRISYQNGIMERSKGEDELKVAKELESKGIDAEKVLAMYEISELPDVDGVLHPLEYFVNKKILRQRHLLLYLRPVILIRAAKSNFRLLDLINLLKLGDVELLRRFVDFLVQEYGRYEKKEKPSREEYFYWLVKKTLKQALILLKEGRSDRSKIWWDQARNRSTMGEELDLEAFHPIPVNTMQDSHFLEQFIAVNDLEKTFLVYALAINKAYEGSIDFPQLAEIFYTEAMSHLSPEELQKIFGGFDRYHVSEAPYAYPQTFSNPADFNQNVRVRLAENARVGHVNGCDADFSLYFERMKQLLS